MLQINRAPCTTLIHTIHSFIHTIHLFINTHLDALESISRHIPLSYTPFIHTHHSFIHTIHPYTPFIYPTRTWMLSSPSRAMYHSHTHHSFCHTHHSFIYKHTPECSRVHHAPCTTLIHTIHSFIHTIHLFINTHLNALESISRHIPFSVFVYQPDPRHRCVEGSYYTFKCTFRHIHIRRFIHRCYLYIHIHIFILGCVLSCIFSCTNICVYM